MQYALISYALQPILAQMGSWGQMVGVVQGTAACDAGRSGRLLCITCSFWL